MKPISRETITERRQPQMRWSAVFAGSVLAVGLWILLQTIGMGLGMSAIDADDTGNLRGIGIGTGVWSLIVPLIALFFGGLLAGRLAGTRSGRVGAMHGSVLWALTSAIGLFFMISVISMLASGITRVGGAAVGAATSAGTAVVSHVGDLSERDLLTPINERLKAQGKPTITMDQVEKSVRAAAQRGLREGRLDRDMLAQELARNTSLSRADVDDLAAQLDERTQQLGQQLGAAGEKAQNVALQAADKTGKALLMGGIALLLGLIAAAGGGALGARMADSDRRRLDRRDGVVPTTVPPPGTIVTPSGTTIVDPERTIP